MKVVNLRLKTQYLLAYVQLRLILQNKRAVLQTKP